MKENNGVLYRLVDGVMEPIAPRAKGMDKLRDRERKMLSILEAQFASANVAP